MSTIMKQLELNFWNVAIPLLTRSQILRSFIQKAVHIYQDTKLVFQIAVIFVIACAGFATGLLAYSISLLFS